MRWMKFCGLLCLTSIFAISDGFPFGSRLLADEPTKIEGKRLEDWAEQLHHEDELLRFRAVATLPQFGPAAATALGLAVSDTNAAIRYRALEALGRMKAGDKQLLLEAMENRSGAVRVAAAYAVLRFGPNEKALKLLTEALSYQGRGLPVCAADFLGELELAEALPALRNTAQHKDYHVKNAAARAIKRIEQASSKK